MSQKKAERRSDIHAEVLVLEKLDTLLMKHFELQNQVVETIILYTWLLPCDRRESKYRTDCKTEIIEKLGQLAEEKHVILVYTSKNSGAKSDTKSSDNPQTKKGVTKEQEKMIVKEFENRKITVKKIKPNYTVAPVECSQ